MILTLRYYMTDRTGNPMSLKEAAAMQHSGKLTKIAADLNKEALAEAGLEYIEPQHIELERTPKGNTVLVVKTAAIFRENHKQ